VTLMRGSTTILIGTSSWTDPTLVKDGNFYPPEAKSAEARLKFYASRFPLVAVFVAKFPAGVRVAVTGAAESGVFRWTEAEEALSADFRPEAVKGLAVDPEGMIGDLHGTPEYRAHLVGVVTARAVAAA